MFYHWQNPMRFYIHTNQWVSIFLEHNFSFQGSIILIVCNASTCLPTYLSHTQWLNVVYKVMCLCRNGACGNKSKERTVRIYGNMDKDHWLVNKETSSKVLTKIQRYRKECKHAYCMSNNTDYSYTMLVDNLVNYIGTLLRRSPYHINTHWPVVHGIRCRLLWTV